MTRRVNDSMFARIRFGVLALWVGCCLPGCGGGGEDDAPAVVEPPAPSMSDSTSSPARDATASETDQKAQPQGAFVMPPLDAPTDANQDSKSAAPAMVLPDADQSSLDAGRSSPSIQYATWQAIEQDVKSSGKLTVIDLWSLACEPCQKEFPGLVSLHRQYGDQLRCVSVDIDFDGRKTRPPETYEPEVTEFLAEMGAAFTNYISQTPSDEIYDTTGITSLPAVIVLDADGKLVKQFVDAGETAGFTYENDVAPLVKELLANKLTSRQHRLDSLANLGGR